MYTQSKRFIYSAAFLSALLFYNIPQIKSTTCGENEIEKDCVGDCEATCQNPNSTCSSEHCTPGCGCKEGFVRRKPGQPCIETDWCELINDFKGECGKNEMVVPCDMPCALSCTDLGPKMCHTDNCVPGCSCLNKYVHKDDSDKTCIPIEECPSNIKVNVDTSYHKIDSQSSQDNFNVNDAHKEIQTEDVHKENTQSTSTLSSSTTTESHVNEMQCEENQIYKECGHKCEDLCEGHGTYFDCKSNCTSGCYCSNGTQFDVRLQKCVEINRCTKLCMRDEEYTDCGNRCKESCRASNCTDSEECQSGCFCTDGMFRNAETGQCVSQEECPIDHCKAKDENSYFTKCAQCQKTCSDIDREISCDEECKAGCKCNEGFYLNDEEKCVKISECNAGQESQPKKKKKISFQVEGVVQIEERRRQRERMMKELAREHLHNKHHLHGKHHGHKHGKHHGHGHHKRHHHRQQ